LLIFRTFNNIAVFFSAVNPKEIAEGVFGVACADEIPRFSWTPKIETILIDNPDMPAHGGGEPPIVNMGAVIANAVYDHSGFRLLRFPMTPKRIREGLNGDRRQV